jgi:hypothetical protein
MGIFSVEKFKSFLKSIKIQEVQTIEAEPEEEKSEGKPEEKKPKETEKAYEAAIAVIAEQVYEEGEQVITFLENESEKISDPETKQKLSELKEYTVALTGEVLEKISEQLGSNTGGWYEHKGTREKYYVKLYENPEQARIEFIANAIYKKLGIPAVESELFPMDGKLAIASKEVKGAKSMHLESMKGDSEIRNGFIADAYLANWDVVGLCYDNIVHGEDGKKIRVDNGGSIIFRAQGGTKDFTPDNIPELSNMLNPNFPAGKVFEAFSEDKLQIQARDLVESLSEADIDEIIKESGLDETTAKKVRDGLIGRRQYLVKRYGLEDTQEIPKNGPKERFTMTREKLNKQLEYFEGLGIYPRVGMSADAEKVENQQIDIILGEGNNVHVNFKLTFDQWKKKLEDFQMEGATASTISYGSTKDPLNIVDCLQKTIGKTITIKLSTGTKSYGWNTEIRAALGLVEIVIVNESDPQEEFGKLGEILHEVLQQNLDIQTGLDFPEKDSESAYKQARYKWHHKVQKCPQEQEKKLQRKEVFPEYFTFVEKEKHKEYEKISPYAIFHKIFNINNLPTIVKGGGLFSTHERFRRNINLNGMSSSQDLSTGGADSVFTRIVTKGAMKGKHNFETVTEGVNFIFEPDLLDRTDWYIFESDQYGATDSRFQQRLSPGEFFEKAKTDFHPGNEQMFRTGIPIEKIKGIVCSNEDEAFRVLEILRDAGITEINGKFIEDFVVHTTQMIDYVNISQGEKLQHGKDTRTTKKDKLEDDIKKTKTILQEMDKCLAIAQNISSMADPEDTDPMKNDPAYITEKKNNINYFIPDLLFKIEELENSATPDLNQISDDLKNQVLEISEKIVKEITNLIKSLASTDQEYYQEAISKCQDFAMMIADAEEHIKETLKVKEKKKPQQGYTIVP